MKRALIALVRWYQRHISAHTAPVCRFTPTCSQYAVEALERFGALRGTLLAGWRILRCNPFGGSGWDPVPETFTFRRKKEDVDISDEELAALYDSEPEETPADEN